MVIWVFLSSLFVNQLHFHRKRSVSSFEHPYSSFLINYHLFYIFLRILATHGIKATITDFIISRLRLWFKHELGQDPELFESYGDYQYEIHQSMEKAVKDDWCEFQPKKRREKRKKTKNGSRGWVIFSRSPYLKPVASFVSH